MHINKLKIQTDHKGNDIHKLTNAFNFSPLGKLKYEYKIASYAFAYAMSFSDEGYHRRNRSGGTHNRRNVEVFCDTFMGKLGEFAIYQYLKECGIDINYPDLEVMNKGKWDTYDFIYENRKIAVKTTKSFGNLLLLETKDWNQNAQYLPNLHSGHSDYDDFLFVRINCDIEKNLKRKRLYYKDSIASDILEKEFSVCKAEFDIAYVSKELIEQIIKKQVIIRKGAYLQSLKTKMDADNYYIQSGDMLKIAVYINLLKSI